MPPGPRITAASTTYDAPVGETRQHEEVQHVLLQRCCGACCVLVMVQSAVSHDDFTI